MADTAREGGFISSASLRQWRIEQLEDAGYPQEEAFLLARRLDVDLHEACDLLRKGCSVKLAVRILT